MRLLIRKDFCYTFFMQRIPIHFLNNANIYLFLSFVFLLFFSAPLYEYFSIPRHYFEFLFLIILFISSSVHSASSLSIKVTFGLLLSILIYYIFIGIQPSPYVFISKIIIVFLAIKELALEIKNTKVINMNIVSGAVCTYLLIGVMFAFLYSLLFMLDPTSFTNVSVSVDDVSPLNFLYYSFVTLTTLGFGDITPSSMTAKFWSITEAIMGVLFIAVLIGRIVSLVDNKK